LASVSDIVIVILEVASSTKPILGFSGLCLLWYGDMCLEAGAAICFSIRLAIHRWFVLAKRSTDGRLAIRCLRVGIFLDTSLLRVSLLRNNDHRGTES
jgi:hypothetical protein